MRIPGEGTDQLINRKKKRTYTKQLMEGGFVMMLCTSIPTMAIK